MKHVITYPGFAESKEARGLYPDIAAYFPGYTYHELPFYEEKLDGEGNPTGERVVHSIEKHKNDIQDCIDSLVGEIIMFAKCGGTRPTVAMDDAHIARLSKLCLVNPPWEVRNDLLKRQLRRWNAHEQPDRSWILPRGKAGRYVITKEYVNDVGVSNMMGRFGEIACSATKLYVVRAMHDEMFPPVQVEKIPGAHPIDIEEGDHHLLGDSRPKVLGELALHGVLEK